MSAIPGTETSANGVVGAVGSAGVAGTGDGTRDGSRAPLEVKVELRSHSNFYVGFSENISEGGIFVATEAPFEPGERMWIELSLLGEEPSLVETEVAWVREENRSTGLPAGMGMRFVDPPSDLARRIQAHIDARRFEPLFYEF
ncbi:TIGR02266 family protein [Myxococcota bacterium]|nr:TIGR02266 family protein [Myxococcota bacterium]